MPLSLFIYLIFSPHIINKKVTKWVINKETAGQPTNHTGQSALFGVGSWPDIWPKACSFANMQLQICKSTLVNSTPFANMQSKMKRISAFRRPSSRPYNLTSSYKSSRPYNLINLTSSYKSSRGSHNEHARVEQIYRRVRSQYGCQDTNEIDVMLLGVYTVFDSGMIVALRFKQ